MSREAHVRICEGVGVKIPRSTRPYVKICLKVTVDSSKYVTITLYLEIHHVI